MNKKALLVSFLLSFILCANIFSQDNEPVERTIVGARIGMSYYLMDKDDFDDIYQEIKPNENMSYFPLLSQFGVSYEQLYKLGKTNHNFSMQSMLLFGGMEKSLILTTFSETLGFRLSNGFLFGLGPIVVFNDELADKKQNKNTFLLFSGDIATLSIEYTIEKRLNIEGVLIPINFRAMLNPKDNVWKFTLITGFDFETNNIKYLK